MPHKRPTPADVARVSKGRRVARHRPCAAGSGSHSGARAGTPKCRASGAGPAPGGDWLAAGSAVEGEAAGSRIVAAVGGLEADACRAARWDRAVVADIRGRYRAAGWRIRRAPTGRDVLAGC